MHSRKADREERRHVEVVAGQRDEAHTVLTKIQKFNM